MIKNRGSGNDTIFSLIQQPYGLLHLSITVAGNSLKAYFFNCQTHFVIGNEHFPFVCDGSVL